MIGAEIYRSKEISGAHTLKEDPAVFLTRPQRWPDLPSIYKEIVAAGGILNREAAIGEAAAHMPARRREVEVKLAGPHFESELAPNGGK